VSCGKTILKPPYLLEANYFLFALFSKNKVAKDEREFFKGYDSIY